MKTNINITTLVAAAAMTASALGNPGAAASPVKILTLAPAQFVPDASEAGISIPVQFARFGAFPHPGAAFAPFETFERIPGSSPKSSAAADRIFRLTSPKSIRSN